MGPAVLPGTARGLPGCRRDRWPLHGASSLPSVGVLLRAPGL